MFVYALLRYIHQPLPRPLTQSATLSLSFSGWRRALTCGGGATGVGLGRGGLIGCGSVAAGPSFFGLLFLGEKPSNGVGWG